MKRINRESDNMRQKLLAQGVSKQEVASRIKQSREDKLAALKSNPEYGKTMKSSLKSETFRPNYLGKVERAKTRIKGGDGALRAEAVAYLSEQNRRTKALNNKKVAQKTLEKAFHDHPREAERIRQTILKSSKTPEERERKKEKKRMRRELAHELTGTSKESWWSPIVNAGADLIPKLLPLLIGMGDYTEEDVPITKADMPESNSLLAGASGGACGTQVPYMHKKGDKVRVQHREYVGDIYSTTSSFSLTSFPLNPGMEELFPWLAPLANCFTYYKLMGMVVDFVSQGTDYANVAGLGYVGYATQYNPLAADFANKKEFMNYQFANAVKPSCNMTHWVECKPGDIPDPERTVRAGVIPANADLRLYDHGKVFLAVGGNPTSGGIIGMMWVSYDVEFYLPKVGGGSSGVIDFGHWQRDGVTAANPLGANAISTSVRNTINWTFSPTVITVPGGTYGIYGVYLLWRGTASPGNVAPGLSVSAGVTTTFSQGGFMVANELCFWNMYWFTFDGTQASYTLTYDNAGTGLPLGTGTNNLVIEAVQIPAAPPASCEIFDPAGVEYEERYDKYMLEILSPNERAKYKSHACRKESLNNDSVVVRFEKREAVRAGLELGGMKVVPSECQLHQAEEKELGLLAKKYSWNTNEKTTVATSTSLGGSPQVVVEVGVNGSSSTSSEEEVPGLDDYTVLRRVGSYGLCSSGDGHFVVRTFDATKWKWWWLSEDIGYEKVFMDTYEELNGSEFSLCIDCIIEKQLKPDQDTKNTVKARTILFRKRGSRDYSAYNPTPILESV